MTALEEAIPRILRLTGTPGLNLAIARDGKVVWEAGFGFADLSRRTPMTPETVFHSGSMAKTYTATAVMQLVERGVLELDAPVNRYLKDFRIVNPLGGREVSVRDLLTHRSGLTGNGAHSTLSTPEPLSRHIPRAFARPGIDFYHGAAPTWTSKPGEQYQYSNLGIATLGYLVEVTNPEGLSFSDYVQKHVIDLLGMTSTQFPPVQDSIHARPDLWRRMSTGYAAIGALRIPTPPIYFADYPAGTVLSTPGDHIKLLLAMSDSGRYAGRRLLRPETVRRMLSPEIAIGGSSSSGLVWRLGDWDGPSRSFGHSGAHMWGWTNSSIAFPDLGLAVVVAMNHWALPDDGATRYREANLIIEFARSWVERERAGKLRPVEPKSWAWKVSYLAGLSLTERINGMLGIAEPLSDSAIESMAVGASVQSQLEHGESLWDPAGFRAGIRALAGIEIKPATVAEFLRSTRLPFHVEELPIIYLELGGRGTLPPAR